MIPPIGLWWQPNHVKVMKSTFENASDRQYILDEIIRDPVNDKPFIVINDTTKECLSYEVNDSMDNFIQTNERRLCRQVKAGYSEFLSRKVIIQRSNRSSKDKVIICNILQKKYRRKEKLTNIERKLIE